MLKETENLFERAVVILKRLTESPLEMFAVIGILVALFAFTNLFIPAYFRALRRLVEGNSKEDSEETERKSTFQRLEEKFESRKIDGEGDVREELKDTRRRLSEASRALEASNRESLHDREGRVYEDWQQVIASSRNRLISETKRLRERSTSNLVWGVGFSIFSALERVASDRIRDSHLA